MDIYQQIWDADQAGNGVKPVLDRTQGSHDHGYVLVNADLDVNAADTQVLPEVVIPDHKASTYELCRELFDNYALPERDEETWTPEEREEIHDFVQAIVDAPPMTVAREYIAQSTGTGLTKERWYNTVMDMWFRTFTMGGDPHLTGFEHVVVGEQQGAKAQGYHFWYKYYLDDGFARTAPDAIERFPNLPGDLITYLGTRQKPEQDPFPETVTISYRWTAPDYERGELRPLTKRTGGFFVGCSVEGLLALGTVRAHLGARAPKEAVINGARYEMKLFRDPTNRHVRTFYPIFRGSVGTPSVPPVATPPATPVGDGNGHVAAAGVGAIRIVAALVNPPGHDPGRETVTLLNTTPDAIRVDGWRLVDKNGRSTELSNMELAAGGVVQVQLSGEGAQLSNKGGRIVLADQAQAAVDTVHYSKTQARKQGTTIVF